ncbi:unnamed protein product, partial [Ectocarpus fasciculatus]
MRKEFSMRPRPCRRAWLRFATFAAAICCRVSPFSPLPGELFGTAGGAGGGGDPPLLLLSLESSPVLARRGAEGGLLPLAATALPAVAAAPYSGCDESLFLLTGGAAAVVATNAVGSLPPEAAAPSPPLAPFGQPTAAPAATDASAAPASCALPACPENPVTPPP